VKDAAGETIIGANVMVKGTNNGTITDMDGHFTLNASPTDVLVVTYMGYQQQEISLNGKTFVNIMMQEDAKALDEVVVVAYGTQKKVNLTAAVETVNSKVLENRPVKSTAQMLEGVVPNLNISTRSGAPDASSSLNIRGFTGMNNDGAVSGGPLVLIDGVAQSLDMINPNDVESISVLKDAAASAIYGSRAPYGVILVTTKSGEKGKKVSINYSGTYQINQPTMLPHSANSVDFARSMNGAFQNSLKEAFFPKETIQRMQDYIDGKITDNNKIMPNGRWGEHTDANANTDYLGYAFKDFSQNTTHDISLSGGTAKSSYYAGLGYSFREGIYNTDQDKYDRYSAILKLDSEITNWLSVSFNSRYVRQETTRPNYINAENSSKSDESFWKSLGYFPNIPIKNPDGSYHRLSAMPMLDGAGGKFANIVDDYWFTGGVKVNPIKDLTIKGNFSWNMQSALMDTNTMQFNITQPNGEVMRSARSANVDKIYKKASRSNYYTMDLTADYHKAFGKHDFTVLGGLQLEYKQNHNIIGSTTGLYTQEIPSLNVSWGDNLMSKDEINHWASMGYFFRASYNYDSRYLLDVNGRYDAASKYPADSRWAFFPSVSAGWNIAREKFWTIDEVSTFKLTGSFGRLGDQGSGNYLYIPTMSTNPNGPIILNGERPPYVSMPDIIPPNITWSKPQSLGFGVEVAAFNNRLRGEYYWYQRTVYDQLGPADKLPEVLGTNPPQTNNAVSETRGWELSLSWRDKACTIAEKPLNYDVRFILSDYIGYVVSYPDNVAGSRSAWTPGQVFGKVYGYHSTGIAADKDYLINNVLPGNGWYYPGDLMYQDANGDGRIDGGVGSTWYSMGDLNELGFSYPRMKYSINLGLDWNNFNLSMLLDGVGKEVRYINNISVFGHTADWSARYMFDQHAELGYWSANNTGAFFPRAYQDSKNFGSANDKYLIDLAHLRIKNIALGYTLPTTTIKKLGLSRLSFNLSIENLGMIYYKSWLDLDPQMIRQNGNGYPIQRTYSLGVKIGI
ncbi:MAG: TonB-dependent receptor, partial [Bacteroides sp.]|uniref:SusC/RagA family TonB-linked outer membrane protein n=2 Tax=Bacteroides sp. TaxID=29523 RepID=UPI002FC717A2